MSGHGIPRVTEVEERSEESRKREQRRIKEYQDLVVLVTSKIQQKEFTPEVLKKISELLTINPEYYTIWNHRRLVLQDQFKIINSSESTNEGDAPENVAQGKILVIIRGELQFLFPLLRKFPKCYWIWKYRLWTLEQATQILPPTVAKQLWQEELALDSKMLSLDSRNFHGWGYRRTVVSKLESAALNPKSPDQPNSATTTSNFLTKPEFDYTTKMISANLSNFSAWHARTKLLQRLLAQTTATTSQRSKAFDDELDLIHRALIDPYDQSIWFYHQALMTSLDSDPRYAGESLVPGLEREERAGYLERERDVLRELLEEEKECKWVYLALMHVAELLRRVRGEEGLAEEEMEEARRWVAEVKKLDPVRMGRWIDLERGLGL